MANIEELFAGRTTEDELTFWRRPPAGPEFNGKVVWVTGAAHGQGRATALLAAERGASVVLADINIDATRAVERRCADLGATTLVVEVDQGDSAKVDRGIGQAVDRFGRIDMQANVAAIFLFKRIVDMSDEQWQRMINVDLSGVFYLCRAAARVMLEQDGGAIVNVGSVGSSGGGVGLGAYAAAKAGLIAFSRTLSVECDPAVRVNVVSPGPVRTQARPNRYPDDNDNELMMALTRPSSGGSPRRRWGDPEELAEVILFLLSDRASFVNGQVLHVNGGMSTG
jgi:NAD(P)-dependent dehydrogenase (short-subunit alcohol dehydrogenase family)